MKEKTYICIDLKSFYASVECRERNLDPLNTNLVVADKSRTEKTICLAVTPSLKAQGVPGRPRLFEVVQKVNAINSSRRMAAPKKEFTGKSYLDSELKQDKSLELDYIVAPPQMALYIDYSVRVYGVYLKYIAPEDIHVYSIDESFMDVTNYLETYKMTAEQLARTMIKDVLNTTGITATAGIGPNLYLCKVAMDIVAKHIPADENGVRIAELDEISYRKLLWDHRPLTDFWRIGNGYARKLERYGMYTLGDVARCSVGLPCDFYNEDLLYKLFGVNAELLIDHVWGWEPCTLKQIKQYKPTTNSLSNGQVLHEAYDFEKARLVAKEMADGLVLDLLRKHLVTNQIVITVGYDIDNLLDPQRRRSYKGNVVTDGYGRQMPKHSHGTINLLRKTSSLKQITKSALDLFDRITDKSLLIRRINIDANHVVNEALADGSPFEQLDLFTDYSQKIKEEEALNKERRMQIAILSIKERYGKNAILKGTNFMSGATMRDRNEQIGGHKA